MFCVSTNPCDLVLSGHLTFASTYTDTHLLLVLLMYRIHRILYRHSSQIASRDFETQWKVEIYLLDRRSDEEFLESVFVLDRRRGGVELPTSDQHCGRTITVDDARTSPVLESLSRLLFACLRSLFGVSVA